MTVNNIIVRNDGDFDYKAEGFDFEVINTTEHSIEYICPITGTKFNEECVFENGTAIIFE